jgi:hypothetical protein
MGLCLGTPCGENRVCYEKQCTASNQTVKSNTTAFCPYGDLFVPTSMLNLEDVETSGNMLCPQALNLLRSQGMNVRHLCYNSNLPFQRLCCEECKK